MRPYVETWKGIAHELGRSERWCRYMATREQDPLPLVGKLGGIVRAEVSELTAWVKRQTADSKLTMLGKAAGSGICTKCNDRVPLRVDGAVKTHEVLFHHRIQRCVGAGRFPKEGTVEAPPAPVSSMQQASAELVPFVEHVFDFGSAHRPDLVGTAVGCPCDQCWDNEMRRG